VSVALAVQDKEQSLLVTACVCLGQIYENNNTEQASITEYSLLFHFGIFRYISAHFGTILRVKAFPLQTWSDPEGSRKLRFPDYMITVQDGGKVVTLTHRPPSPSGNAPGTHFC
jgi:hypothetical protein